MSDLISRQAAIDAIVTWLDFVNRRQTLSLSYTDVANKILRVPSAEPEIVRCKDCKYWKVGTVSKICTKGIITSIMNRGDEFCSYAERRTNE